MTVGVTVRRASADDAGDLACVHLASARTAYRDIFPPSAPAPTLESLAEEWRGVLATAGATVLVAGDPVVGCIALVPGPQTPTDGLLTRFYVEPAAWGRGVGRSLYDKLLAVARADGLGCLGLWVLEHNHRARAMYERWGWRLVVGEKLVNDEPTIFDVRYELDLVRDPPG